MKPRECCLLKWLSWGFISGSWQNQDYHQCYFFYHITRWLFGAHCSLLLMNHLALPTSFLTFMISVPSFLSPVLSPNPRTGYPCLEDCGWLTGLRTACLSSCNWAAMRTKVIRITNSTLPKRYVSSIQSFLLPSFFFVIGTCYFFKHL